MCGRAAEVPERKRKSVFRQSELCNAKTQTRSASQVPSAQAERSSRRNAKRKRHSARSSWVGRQQTEVQPSYLRVVRRCRYTCVNAIFERTNSSRHPVSAGISQFQSDPHFRDLILFHEYFHGDNGAGVGRVTTPGGPPWSRNSFNSGIREVELEKVLTLRGPQTSGLRGWRASPARRRLWREVFPGCARGACRLSFCSRKERRQSP
jgi:hypothetical protein